MSLAAPLSSFDVAALRAAEQALAESFEASDPTAWDFYTDDAIFVPPARFLAVDAMAMSATPVPAGHRANEPQRSKSEVPGPRSTRR